MTLQVKQSTEHLLYEMLEIIKLELNNKFAMEPMHEIFKSNISKTC